MATEQPNVEGTNQAEDLVRDPRGQTNEMATSAGAASPETSQSQKGTVAAGVEPIVPTESSTPPKETSRPEIGKEEAKTGAAVIEAFREKTVETLSSVIVSGHEEVDRSRLEGQIRKKEGIDSVLERAREMTESINKVEAEVGGLRALTSPGKKAIWARGGAISSLDAEKREREKELEKFREKNVDRLGTSKQTGETNKLSRNLASRIKEEKERLFGELQISGDEAQRRRELYTKTEAETRSYGEELAVWQDYFENKELIRQREANYQAEIDHLDEVIKRSDEDEDLDSLKRAREAWQGQLTRLQKRIPEDVEGFKGEPGSEVEKLYRGAVKEMKEIKRGEVSGVKVEGEEETASESERIKRAYQRRGWREIQEVEALGKGELNIFCLVTLIDGENEVVKIAPKWEGRIAYLEKEKACREIAGKAGVAVARVKSVYAWDPDLGNFSVDECAPGTTPRFEVEKERKEAIKLMAEQLRMVHEIEIPGRGFIWRDGKARPDISWQDYLLKDFENPKYRWSELVDEGVIDKGLFLMTKKRLNLLAQSLPNYGRLVHGDPKLDNLRIKNGEVTALLDWENALSGDPLYDLSFFDVHYNDSQATRIFRTAYGMKNIPGEDLAERDKFYKIYLLLIHIGWYKSRDDEEMVDKRRRQLKLLLG